MRVPLGTCWASGTGLRDRAGAAGAGASTMHALAGQAQRGLDLMCAQRSGSRRRPERQADVQNWIAERGRDPAPAHDLKRGLDHRPEGSQAARVETIADKFFGAKVLQDVLDRDSGHGVLGSPTTRRSAFMWRQPGRRIYDDPTRCTTRGARQLAEGE